MKVYRGYHLTVRGLRLMRACTEQVAIFKAEWPNGVTLSRRALLRAAKIRLDVDWFARQVLDAPARAELNRVTAQALWDVLPRKSVKVERMGGKK